MLELHRCRLIDWNPTAGVALASSVDGAAVAAARENGDIEIWRVAAGSVGWACEQRIPGRKDAAISSLVWIGATAQLPRGRLFSSGLDGLITEWDLATQTPRDVTDSLGGSVWDMAPEPVPPPVHRPSEGHTSFDSDEEEEEEEGVSDDDEGEEEGTRGGGGASISAPRDQRMAVACDDGCVRLFVAGSGPDGEREGLVLQRAFQKTKGRVLSLAWNENASRMYAGNSNGIIHCWSTTSWTEVYRITVGTGGLSSSDDLCVWALQCLRDGSVVSGDSSGSTQFWSASTGTLLSCHTRHRGDVLALAATPSHSCVFAAGVDGQICVFRSVREPSASLPAVAATEAPGHWVFEGSSRAHSPYDVRALAMASAPVEIAEQEEQRGRRGNSASRSSHARGGEVPMLVSGGNDAALYTLTAEAPFAFQPHNVCPAPQAPRMTLSASSPTSSSSPTQQDGGSSRLLLVQRPFGVDVWRVAANADKGATAAAAGGGRHRLTGGTSMLALPPSQGQNPLASPANLPLESSMNSALHSQLEGLPNGLVAPEGEVCEDEVNEGEGGIGTKRLREGNPEGGAGDLQATTPGGKKRRKSGAQVNGESTHLAGGEGALDGNRKSLAVTLSRPMPSPSSPLSTSTLSLPSTSYPSPPSPSSAPLSLVAKITSNGQDLISCSAISPDGRLVAFSDAIRLRIYELRPPSLQDKFGNGYSSTSRWRVERVRLPIRTTGPPAPSSSSLLSRRSSSSPDMSAVALAFTPDSQRLLVSTHLEGIKVLDIPPSATSSPSSPLTIHSLVHPSSSSLASTTTTPSASSPTSVLSVSSDCRWLAAASPAGRISVFDLRSMRHHWDLPPLSPSSLLSSLRFLPSSALSSPSSLLLLATSNSELLQVDVVRKDFTKWSQRNSEKVATALGRMAGGGIVGLSVWQEGKREEGGGSAREGQREGQRERPSTVVAAYTPRCIALIDVSHDLAQPEEAGAESAATGGGSSVLGTSRNCEKRKGKQRQQKGGGRRSEGDKRKGVVLIPNRNPALFVCHTGPSRVLVVEKEWEEVESGLHAPFYWHKYGT